MTVTLQIGNSDDRLSQASWSKFVIAVHTRVYPNADQLHFFGTAPGDSRYQNACWVFEMTEAKLSELKQDLAPVKEMYHQDSIAITTGKTHFI